MKKLLQIIFLSVFVTIGVQARDTVPLINYEDVNIVTSSGKKPTMTQVKAAIVAAAQTPMRSSGGQTWVMKETSANQMTGTLDVRDKHHITITVTYNENKFSVVYKDSVNMHYEPTKVAQAPMSTVIVSDKPHIHPYYNNWVKSLVNNIRREIQKL